jgi:AraC-like DNA-binding protein/mannose-6-phosphate isomerase-like protein (cupin superfamily)
MIDVMRPGRVLTTTVPVPCAAAADSAPGPGSEARRVEFRIWRSATIPGLEVIHTNSHAHSYPPHMHDSLEIIWIRAGEGKLDCLQQAFDIRPGEAGIVRPNEIHSGGGRGNTIEYVAIHLPRSLLRPGGRRFYALCDESGRSAPVKVVSRDKASSLLPIMVRTLCADLPVDRLLYILTPILCQLLDVPTPDSDLILDDDVLHPAVSKAQAIIRDQCANRVDISELATSVDLDMRYLISLFKLSTGTTPHQFQIAMRVEMARALLEQQIPLCDVAARAGFSDQSHLNRHFRRRYGFTPGEFREAVVVRPSIVV